MPIHPDDLRAFEAMTGGQLIPEGFEAEYEKWLSLNHRRGQHGGIGDLMVPLCRMFSLSPPVTPKAQEQVQWRSVAKGARVIVILNGVAAKGIYMGLGPYGEVEVAIAGQSWIQAVKPFQVQLDMSHELPADLKLNSEERAAMKPFEAGLPEIVKPVDEFPTLDATVIDDDEEALPKMADPKWYAVNRGKTLDVAREGEEAFKAKFLRIGPGDGQVVALVNGEEELLDEAYTTIAPVATRKPTKTTKKGAKKK